MSWVFPEGNPYRVGSARLAGYDVAEICTQGHPITFFARTQPSRREKFCSKCGDPTITACTKCSEPIRGYYHVPHVISAADEHPPAFCHACGEPYPWTAAKLRAAQEFAQELDELSGEDKGKLKTGLADIVKDTPATSLAVIRIKKIAAKLGKSAGESLYKIAVDIASETAKKMLESKS